MGEQAKHTPGRVSNARLREFPVRTTDGIRCRACGGWRGPRYSEGVSGLYSPDREYTLCEPCWEDEDALTEATGTNEHPEIVAAYRSRTGTGLALIRAAIAKAEVA